MDPAGLFHPGPEKLPQPPDWEPDGELDYQVLWLERKGRRRWWVTEDGTRDCDLTWKEALDTFPELIAVHSKLAANRSRFRRIHPEKPKARITLDTGQELLASKNALMNGLHTSWAWPTSPPSRPFVPGAGVPLRAGPSPRRLPARPTIPNQGLRGFTVEKFSQLYLGDPYRARPWETSSSLQPGCRPKGPPHRATQRRHYIPRISCQRAKAR